MKVQLVQKEGFGSITSTVAYLNCQERSKRRGSVRKWLYLVRQTEIPLNFLKELCFPGLERGGGVFAAGIGAFHGVLISLKTQNLPTG